MLMKSSEDRWVEWARENVPLLAWRDDREVRRLIRVARDDVRGWRYALAIGSVILSVLTTYWAQNQFSGDAMTGAGTRGGLLFIVAFFAVFAGFLSDALVRRRIAELAGKS